MLNLTTHYTWVRGPEGQLLFISPNGTAVNWHEARDEWDKLRDREVKLQVEEAKPV